MRCAWPTCTRPSPTTAWPAAGAILFLEDINEELYRIDRLLTQLRLAGVLDAVAGIVLGSFTEEAAPLPLVLLIGDFIAAVDDVLRLLGANTQRFISGRSRPRAVHHFKPHPSAVYKG